MIPLLGDQTERNSQLSVANRSSEDSILNATRTSRAPQQKQYSRPSVRTRAPLRGAYPTTVNAPPLTSFPRNLPRPVHRRDAIAEPDGSPGTGCGHGAPGAGISRKRGTRSYSSPTLVASEGNPVGSLSNELRDRHGSSPFLFYASTNREPAPFGASTLSPDFTHVGKPSEGSLIR